MVRKINTFLALICAAALVLGCVPINGYAAEGSFGETDTDVTVLVCSEIELYRDNEYIGTGAVIGSDTYVPLVAFMELMLGQELDAEWDAENGAVSLTYREQETCPETADEQDFVLPAVFKPLPTPEAGDTGDNGDTGDAEEDFCLEHTLGQQYIHANGRYAYLEAPAYNICGTLMMPLRPLAHLLGLELEWDGGEWSVNIITDNMALPAAGEEYYNEDDLYWLSHVIYAESGNQPIEGMMGVGNVVLNRAADPSGIFGDTVEEVIFQPGQFSVVENGSINLEPNELSVIAAKLCLEGFNTVGESLFFLNPRTGSSRWVDAHRTFYASIADHDFYT